MSDNEGVRLQKVLAEAGIGSRRHCEELIGEGRVEVNGQRVFRFGERVDPESDVIKVDGRRVETRSEMRYYMINKPRGVVSTMKDERGRKSLASYVEVPERLFHVGRLDTDTEGLILLTNDGELAHRLTHPSFGVSKMYLAEIHGPIPRDLGRRLRKGVELEDGFAKADEFRIFDQVGRRILVEITLHEGRKHIVRRLLKEVGFPVQQLARVEFGPLKLGQLKPGHMRALSVREVGELYKAVDL
ncbi:pseudouridine synthase [Actinomadura harenae]|uniref:Pseudouridine synthase n=1 Tax=Actinomadura harenae TaxID=2483351 RepID=A0A3M2M2S6_9ACTN|nr:pseudouridine synthase [Actinomadura harenae]RMI43702.1 rRNA pseudouridine synthase [Actinomadura harenae]